MEINAHAQLPSPSDTSLDRLDEQYTWHPFSQTAERHVIPPIHVKTGKGSWLEDEQGNKYLDGYASAWTNVHGHCCKELDEALKNQIEKISHSTYLGLANEPASKLAQKLSDLTENRLSRTFFTETGACAIEVAIKQSLRYWQLTDQKQRKILISMEGAYHGDTFATMSLSDDSPFTTPWKEWALPVCRFKAPVHHELGGEVFSSDTEESLQDLKRILKKHKAHVSALILEPSVQGVAGMAQQPIGFLKKVSDLCKEEGCHLILDEIFVGFGRLGNVLVGEANACKADFICMGKGLSGGYLPLAACLTNEERFEAFTGPFLEHKTFYHGHTFTANPLAASVALASLELLEANLNDNALEPRIQWFGECLRNHFFGHPYVSEVRQRGFAACIDLKPSPGGEFRETDRIGRDLCVVAREKGILLRPLLNSIPLVPVISMTREELSTLCTKTRESLDLLTQQKYE